MIRMIFKIIFKIVILLVVGGIGVVAGWFGHQYYTMQQEKIKSDQGAIQKFQKPTAIDLLENQNNEEQEKNQ